MAGKSSKNNTEKRKTLGQQTLEQAQKGVDSYEIGDLAPEMLKNAEKSLYNAVSRGKRRFPKDFIIEGHKRIQKVNLHGMIPIEWRFIERQSCPTPTYDQTVLLYHHQSNELEFLWEVPDKNLVDAYKIGIYPGPSNEALIPFIEDFLNGNLDRRCAKMNNEPYPLRNLVPNLAMA